MLQKNEWQIDNSKHKYGKKIGYKWEGVNSNGIYREGIASTKDEAERYAMLWASEPTETILGIQ
jgi:hypothetical protein